MASSLSRQKTLSFNSLEAMRGFAPIPKDRVDAGYIGFGPVPVKRSAAFVPSHEKGRPACADRPPFSPVGEKSII
jgi:hypothetical protein